MLTGFNRIISACTLCAFSLSQLNAIIPIPPNQNKIEIKDVRLAIRLESLIKKINKSFKKNDLEKLLDLFVDLKFEVETYLGKKINLNEQIKTVEKEIKKNNTQLDVRYVKNIIKLLEQKERKTKYRAELISFCDETGFDRLDDYQEFLFFSAEDKVEIQVPIKVYVGITLALCGVFLAFVPIPLCTTWGTRLLVMGGGYAADGIMEEFERQRQEKKK